MGNAQLKMKKEQEHLERCSRVFAKYQLMEKDIARLAKECFVLKQQLGEFKFESENKPQVTLVSPCVLQAPLHLDLFDVAVASRDEVFVATEAGVTEYDATGCEVSQPLTEGKVVTLGMFSDGRIAAGIEHDPFRKIYFAPGLHARGAVTVLQRDATQSARVWKISATFNIKVAPGCLAVSEDDSRISVAEGMGGGGCIIYIYSPNGDPLLEIELDHFITNLRSTTEGLIVSDLFQHPLPIGAFIVETYDYSGQRLWRCLSNEPALGLCCHPTSGLLLMAVPMKSGVRVLRKDQQMTTEDIVEGSEAVAQIVQMSMNRQATSLAVVSGYSLKRRTVIVFSVV